MSTLVIRLTYLIITMEYFNDIQFTSGGIIPKYKVDIEGRSPGFHAVAMILEGKMYYSLEHRKVTVLDKPAIFWHSSDYHFKFGSCPGHTYHQRWVSFRGKRGDKIMQEGFIKVVPDGYTFIHTPQLYAEIFRELVHLSKSNFRLEQYKAVILLERLLCFLAEERNRNTFENPVREALMKLGEKISEFPFKKYDFERESSKAGLSYSHFRKLFRKIVGYSPHDFLLTCQMRKAAEKIKGTDKQLKEIAFTCGFSNYTQFSRLFKKKIGISPEKYRNSIQG